MGGGKGGAEGGEEEEDEVVDKGEEWLEKEKKENE